MEKTKKSSKKKTKKIPNKYKEKIVVNGSFEDLMKELITPKRKAIK